MIPVKMRDLIFQAVSDRFSFLRRTISNTSDRFRFTARSEDSLSCVVRNNRRKKEYPQREKKIARRQKNCRFWVGEILSDRFSSRRNERPDDVSFMPKRTCGRSKVSIVTMHHMTGHRHELGLDRSGNSS